VEGNYILEAVEAIDNSSIEAEINIIDSLINAYVKEYTMLQYTDSAVVQEAGGIKLPPKDKVVPPTGRKGESLIKKIVLFIPRLLINAIVLILRGVDKFAKFISGSKKTDEMPVQVPFVYEFYISMAALDEPDAWLRGMVEIFCDADVIDDIFVNEDGDTFADRLFKSTTSTQVNILDLTEKLIEDMRESGSDEDMTRMIPWTEDLHNQLVASNQGLAGQPRNIARQMRGIIMKLNAINSEMKDSNLYSDATRENIMKLRNDIMYIVNVYNKANQACNPPKA